MWWLFKKTKGRRGWIAYEVDGDPQPKEGYEMRGPFKSERAAVIAGNKLERATP